CPTAASATRFGTPSLANKRRRWVFTVCSEMYRRLAAVSSVPRLAWSSSERANREDKWASRPGCSMDDNYRPQTCTCQSVWRLGAKRTCLPLLNCSQHEAFTVARTVQKRFSVRPGWPYAYLSLDIPIRQGDPVKLARRAGRDDHGVASPKSSSPSVWPRRRRTGGGRRRGWRSSRRDGR